eukprot:Skav220351  [mRNA]  locus=scaffold4342:86145:86981:+ [translate_table: standard]
MSCRRCDFPTETSRSDLCVGCSAIQCIDLELGSNWGGSSFRRIAVDLALSTARQTRALRLASLRAVEAGVEAQSSRGRLVEAKQEEVPAPIEKKEKTTRSEPERRTPQDKKDKTEAKEVKAESAEYSYSEESEATTPQEVRGRAQPRAEEAKPKEAKEVGTTAKAGGAPPAVKEASKEGHKETAGKQYTEPQRVEPRRSHREEAERSRSRGRRGRNRHVSEERAHREPSSRRHRGSRRGGDDQREFTGGIHPSLLRLDREDGERQSSKKQEKRWRKRK